MTRATTAWRAACNGAGKRPWLVCRHITEHPRGNSMEWHEDKNGNLIWYGSFAAAKKKAKELNA